MPITLYAIIKARKTEYESKLEYYQDMVKRHPIRNRCFKPDIIALEAQIKELADILLIIKSVGQDD